MMIPTWQVVELEAALYPLAKEAGAKDPARVVSGIIHAVYHGEDADEMIESLRRNQPNLFHRIRPAYERKDPQETRQDQREYRGRR